jgi:signal transduction histidine kinase
VFQLFITTKTTGSGVGLATSCAKSSPLIRIILNTPVAGDEPGNGTIFKVSLPYRAQSSHNAAGAAV